MINSLEYNQNQNGLVDFFNPINSNHKNMFYHQEQQQVTQSHSQHHHLIDQHTQQQQQQHHNMIYQQQQQHLIDYNAPQVIMFILVIIRHDTLFFLGRGNRRFVVSILKLCY